jgi:Zn finger protein HypA/HybF involved in hydrogenase expression
MTAAWTIVAVLGPPLAAVVSGTILRPRQPSPQLAIALNTLVPGCGLAAQGRPILETVIGVLFSQFSLILAGGIHTLWMYVPSMIVGGLWALFHTPLSPLLTTSADGGHRLVDRIEESSTSAESPRSIQTQRSQQDASKPGTRDDDEETIIESHYCVEIRCTECGAAVPVPVLHHMAHCTYCGSDHLVVGHEETLMVTLPERVYDTNVLREALLDHYRYQYYLKLYGRMVAPLARNATEAAPSGALVNRTEFDAAIDSAEVAVSRKADSYRARLADNLHVGQTMHFLTPYRHGMGTLYQATFGRSPRDHEKLLRFDVGTIEASLNATATVDLPPMGKLSYLRALRPAVDLASDLQTLPMAGSDQDLERGFGDLDRKRLTRDIQVIKLGSRFTREITAVVWRPWWIAEVRGPDIDETVLLDGAAGSVVGPAPRIDPSALIELPREAREPGRGLRFVPMECPTCGYEFSFDPDAVLHFCHNCHRVCNVVEGRKIDVPYAHIPLPEEAGWDLVPFWRFPLRLRTGGGELLTDLMRLKDGIDGTFDQIGEDAPNRQHVFYVPAIRCINPRLMANAFNRLFLYAIRNRPPKELKRFPADLRPQPWTVSLAEPEARDLAPLYLANVFSRRDIARVNIHQVASWLFEATQVEPGHLMYLSVPQVVTEPFRRYVGRFRDDAVHYVTGQS